MTRLGQCWRLVAWYFRLWFSDAVHWMIVLLSGLFHFRAGGKHDVLNVPVTKRNWTELNWNISSVRLCPNSIQSDWRLNRARTVKSMAADLGALTHALRRIKKINDFYRALIECLENGYIAHIAQCNQLLRHTSLLNKLVCLSNWLHWANSGPYCWVTRCNIEIVMDVLTVFKHTTHNKYKCD